MATPTSAGTPLTTTFTPPASCLSQLYWSYEGAFQLGPGTECIPSGPEPTLHSYFSPGLYCPESWTVACQSEVTLGAVTETRAQCCPRADGIESFSFSSFSCNSVSAAESSSYKSWYESLGCTMNLGTLASQGYVNVVATGGTPYTTSVLFDSDGGLNAYSVQIAWQASDLVSETSALGSSITGSTATTTTSTSTQSQITTAIPSASSDPAPNGRAKSHGLSKAATIAIGVSVPVVVLLAVAGGLLFSRRRMARSRLSYSSAHRPTSEVPEPQLSAAPVHELYGSKPRSELPGERGTQPSTSVVSEQPAHKEGVIYG